MAKRIIIRNGKKYTVTVADWDAGWSNEVGSGSIEPFVWTSAPFVVTPPSSQTVTAVNSSSIKLIVSAAPAGPFDNLTYQWNRNGVNVTNNAFTSGSNGFTLYLNNITSSAVAGTYTVAISTIYGSTSSIGAILTVS